LEKILKGKNGKVPQGELRVEGCSLFGLFKGGLSPKGLKNLWNFGVKGGIRPKKKGI